MQFQKPDANYWDDKLAAYLHDPMDKVFEIRRHEERAARLLEVFGVQKPNKKFWVLADSMAAGFERGQVPSYSNDENRNGAINFSLKPILTHPTSRKTKLQVDFSNLPDTGINEIHEQLLTFVKEKISDYSNKFQGYPERFPIARFLYTHLVLRFRLAEENIAGLGGLWHRLPADSRFPDHSIWQHNALTSALYSCMGMASDPDKIGLMVFSITPVQTFIAVARKLRDYWTGSVLLSWLAFEGIKWVLKNLGPDHVLYPSLIDQPLINRYLEKEWKTGRVSSYNKVRDVASLPNKFLFLIPMESAQIIGKSITEHIKSEWSLICEYILERILAVTNCELVYIREIFERQTDNFWNFDWSVAKLLSKKDSDEYVSLLPENMFKTQEQVLGIFNNLLKSTPYQESEGQGILYSTSHSLVQAALAAQKVQRKIYRKPEPGEKCHLCGQFEILHCDEHTKGAGAAEYNNNINQFWSKFRDGWKAEFDFDENEKLCSVCLIKRIAYRVLEEKEEHILHETFKDMEFYPSTTELALYNYFKRKKIEDPKEKHRIAQEYHEPSGQIGDNRDNYYAILLMDGDKMGDLVCGKTLASTWQSAMHPDLFTRLRHPHFEPNYRRAWGAIFSQCNQRLLTPSIHAAISEALADFSIYGVASIVAKNGGRLIYAGGDDVCAALPVDTVLDAAKEIKGYYNSNFKLISEKETGDLQDPWIPRPGKLSVLLGDEEDKEISISAGILICHHKENLSMILSDAHELLSVKAKDENGRNSCAIELRKRSGGSRFFVRKWNDEAWESFDEVGKRIRSKNKQQISMSLVYRLEQYRDGIEAILERDNYEKLLVNFVAKQLDRSILANHGNEDDSKLEELAEKMVKVTISKSSNGRRVFQPEGLIIAAFIADKGGDN